MHSALAKTIAQAGLVDQSFIEQFKRWGLPVPDASTPREIHIESLLLALEDALQQDELTLIRTTDLDVLQEFLDTRKQATLHLELGNAATEFALDVGKSPRGEFIIPWRSGTITEEMANGQTYLLYEGREIFFDQAEELWYGEQPAFLLCREAHRGDK